MIPGKTVHDSEEIWRHGDMERDMKRYRWNIYKEMIFTATYQVDYLWKLIYIIEQDLLW